MAVADNTRMKSLEAEVKKLYQMLEAASEENKVERARNSEATSIKFNAIQSSLNQLLQERSILRSPTHTLTHGSNSGGDFQPRCGLTRRVNFDLAKFDRTDALGWIFSMDQYFDFFRVPKDE
ncbi:hypothetical protein PIB30_012181 [Stylosanthes scabra]|uniref:Uncharacterized protein n=1 Tax=Stylosanthes scabra TaxID=79078 RepID=A0ABU6U5X4_9FABA|nr:hypothetical protein [Stylosanthes scabra]